MNKRRNKLSIQDIADNISALAYEPVLDNALYYNEQTSSEEYASGELAYHINEHIVYYCKEIIDKILPLL